MAGKMLLPFPDNLWALFCPFISLVSGESETGSLEHIVDEQYNIAARQLGLKTRSHC